MKKLYFVLFIISILNQSYSQPITFDDSTFINFITIDTNIYPTNVWQIGSPNEVNFSQAYSLPNAIVTDTSQPYPINNISVFYVRYITPIVAGTWESTYFQFRYKVDSDENLDFGKIEFSYNNGQNWIDYLTDTLFNNCYSGDIPYFTGTVDNWEYYSIETNPECFGFFEGDTILYKVTFVSDSIHTYRDGLIIDNIELFDVYQNIIEKKDNSVVLMVQPNPSNGDIVTLKIEISSLRKNMELKCIDTRGKLLFNKNNISSFEQVYLDTQNWQSGIYVAIIISNGEVIGQTKFILK
ncbi:MAG: T9SS type A sorting domain-containing protein [Bacteroidales bacterium]|nr:T9SS type A sorting domain-containing protein [Bacteroidales bacterium]